MSRLFDPIALANENLEANATKRSALPTGETTAQIMELKFSDGIIKQGDNKGKPWNRLDCKVEITDPEYLANVAGKPEKVVTTLGVMLDMDNGKIAIGENKNVRLGKLRAATHTNGKPLNMLVGQWLRITIGQKPHPTETDEDGNPIILDEITGYTRV